MEDVVTTVFCELCETEFNLLARNYEKIIQEDQPILCVNCFNKVIEEQEKADIPERKQFEYMIASAGAWSEAETDNEITAFSLYGQDGWELVTIHSNKAYFKREYVKGLN